MVYYAQKLEIIFYNTLARYLVHSRWGARRSLQLVDKLKAADDKRISILFLCNGNICRSPYAEHKAKKLLSDRKLKSTSVSSAGIATNAGKSANPTAIRVASELNINLDNHKTTEAEPSLLSQADLIMVMEPRQIRYLKNLDPRYLAKTMFLGSFGFQFDRSLIIEDPYSQADEIFKKCFQRIDHALSELINRLA